VTLRFIAKKYRESIRSRYLDKEGGVGRMRGVSTKIIPESVHYDTRILVQRFSYKGSAVKGIRWGLHHLNIDSDADISIADIEEMNSRGVVLSPTVSWETFKNQHEKLGTLQMETVRETVVEEKRIIYFPVWRFTVRYNDLVYDQFICASSGHFLKGTAPQSMKSRATAFSISYAVTAFISSGCIVMMTHFMDYMKSDADMVMSTLDFFMVMLSLPLLILIAVLTAVASYGWDKFRYQPEVVLDPTSASIRATGKHKKTWLDKVSESTLENVSRQLEGFFE
jgi:hypothetical protein